jgi:hypothetical protein
MMSRRDERVSAREDLAMNREDRQREQSPELPESHSPLPGGPFFLTK